MGLGKRNLNTQPLIAESLLTGNFVTYDWIDIRHYEDLILYISYKMGAAESGNDVEIKIEFAPDDNKSPHVQTEEDITSGINDIVPLTNKFTAVSAAETYDRFVLPVNIAAAKYFRISVKENGVASNYGSIIVNSNFGWN